MNILSGSGITNVLLRNVVDENATSLSDEFENLSFKGAEFITSITKAPGLDSITLTIMGIDTESGKAYIVATGLPLAVASPTVAFPLKIYPGITPADNLRFSDVLPGKFKLLIQHTGNGNFDYTVSANLIP